MVKNSTGGNKSKKQARKTAINHYQPAKEIRKAKEEGEIYAAVSKILGGKECEVVCIDNKTRRCVMRSKFTFRGKAENNLSVGTMILVGLREWEVRHTGFERCDLLEVYSLSEKERLKQCESCDFSAINPILLGSSIKEEEVFSNFQTMNDDEDGEDDKDDKDEVVKDSSIVKDIIVDNVVHETAKSQVDWMINENDI
jgi:translation initiation factor 1A